jgi:hypothetical protein
MISGAQFDSFVAWTPLFFLIVIYAIVYYLKRGERAPSAQVAKHAVCTACGRRKPREHMLPRNEDGAVNWYCTRCSDR